GHIRTIEMRENGKVLYGKNLFENLPLFSIDNLEHGRLRELILVRLFNLLIYTPFSIVQKKYDEPTELLFKYLLARNLLEIPTILLPFIGINRTSYTSRFHWIKENREILISNGVGADFIESQEKALNGKLNLCFSQTLTEMLEETLISYRKLICWCIKHKFNNSDDAELISIIKKNGLNMLEGRQGVWRFYKLYELFLGIRSLKDINIRKLISWFNISKRDYAVVFMILMHQSLLNHLKDDQRMAESCLNSALDILQMMSLKKYTIKDDTVYEKKWAIMRKQFVKQILPVMRWEKRSDEYARVLSLKYVK
ncbi:MAG: hypothetical protein KAI72_05015, partial [Candidatus Pacebacteria bacterium]|nr:hypothetical protein [Candidatus Paceibacterota bacterium]